MNLGVKSDSVRFLGTEILRVSHSIVGFEEVSEKIFSFYEALVLTSVKGAKGVLEEQAKNAFEDERNKGTNAVAFFKKYNYLITCSAERIGEAILKVAVIVSLKRGTENLVYVENVHFWDVDGDFMMSKNRIKKALSERRELVKK